MLRLFCSTVCSLFSGKSPQVLSVWRNMINTHQPKPVQLSWGVSSLKPIKVGKTLQQTPLFHLHTPKSTPAKLQAVSRVMAMSASVFVRGAGRWRLPAPARRLLMKTGPRSSFNSNYSRDTAYSRCVSTGGTGTTPFLRSYAKVEGIGISRSKPSTFENIPAVKDPYRAHTWLYKLYKTVVAEQTGLSGIPPNMFHHF